MSTKTSGPKPSAAKPSTPDGIPPSGHRQAGAASGAASVRGAAAVAATVTVAGAASVPDGIPPSAPGHPARSVLVELADLLEAERAALVTLDRGAIESFATRKLELDQALQRAVGAAKLGASEQALLERVRQSALSNQLLLAHARSCVQGVLSLLTPANAPRYTAPGQQGAHGGPDAPPPIALNLRR